MTQRNIMKYNLPKDHKFVPENSFYTKPPRKFVGYFQFANSRRGHSAPENLAPLDRGIEAASYNNYTKQTPDHHRNIDGLKPQSRPSASNADSYSAYKGASRHPKFNIAKVIQDEFVKTHSNRLSKLPSFLSTHMTRFNSTGNFHSASGNATSREGREQDHTSEKSVHMKFYNQNVQSHLKTTDPESRRKVEEVLAELNDKDEDRVLLNDQGSFCSTIRERSVTTLSAATNPSDFQSNTRLKSRDFYRNKLRAQNMPAFNTQEQIEKPVERPVLKGTLNVQLPSPNDLFEKDIERLKTLYPQNYLMK